MNERLEDYDTDFNGSFTDEELEELETWDIMSQIDFWDAYDATLKPN